MIDNGITGFAGNRGAFFLPMQKESSLITAAAEAMATRFEVALHGYSPARLEAAAGEALEEIVRIESLLSRFQPTSQIAHCNARAAHEPVPVSPEVFALLRRCGELTEATNGAFDVTVAPLMNCWRFTDDTHAMPSESAIAAALAVSGMDKMQLDEDEFSVQFAREGVSLDLGSVGKGYALECAAALLVENEFENFLIHGGTSTVASHGTQPGGSPWRIAIEHPDENEPPLLTVALHDESVSVSGLGGKSFIDADGVKHGHVINPRTGRAGQGAAVAAVVCKSATESDARATALLVDAAVGENSPFAWLRAEEVNGRLTVDSHWLE